MILAVRKKLGYDIIIVHERDINCLSQLLFFFSLSLLVLLNYLRNGFLRTSSESTDRRRFKRSIGAFSPFDTYTCRSVQFFYLMK